MKKRTSRSQHNDDVWFIQKVLKLHICYECVISFLIVLYQIINNIIHQKRPLKL